MNARQPRKGTGATVVGFEKSSDPYAGANRIRFEGFPRSLYLVQTKPSGFSASCRGSPWNVAIMALAQDMVNKAG